MTVVRQLVDDHAEDEGRHHASFRSLFTRVWPQLSARDQADVGPLLPQLVLSFLEPDRVALEGILRACGFGEVEARQAVAESYPVAAVVDEVRAASAATLRLFRQHDVLDELAAYEAFAALGLLDSEVPLGRCAAPCQLQVVSNAIG